MWTFAEKCIVSINLLDRPMRPEARVLALISVLPSLVEGGEEKE
jgi:hypothetical protein